MFAPLALDQYQVTRVTIPRSTSNGLWSALAATTASVRPSTTGLAPHRQAR